MNRHRHKFVVTGVVIASGVLALRYAQRKLIEYHESKAKEFFERTRRTQHFESTERTCNQTIMGLGPNLIEKILKHLNADDVVEQLRHNPDRKIELWNRVKVLAISRLCALVYACSMLVITLRVQLNILGGYLYKDAVNAEELVSNDIQQNYVALVQHFLNEGCESLCNLIQSKVEHILSGYDLSRKLTLAETEQIFWSIQMAINSDANDPSNKLATFVFPNDLPASTSNPLYEQMFNETIDILESTDVAALNANNVSRGFSVVMDNIADFYFKPINGSNGSRSIAENGIFASEDGAKITEINDDQPESDSVLPNISTVSIPLPKLIPIINGLAKQTFSNTTKPPSLSTSLVTLYLISDKVKVLGANVYETFCQ